MAKTFQSFWESDCVSKKKCINS